LVWLIVFLILFFNLALLIVAIVIVEADGAKLAIAGLALLLVFDLIEQLAMFVIYSRANTTAKSFC